MKKEELINDLPDFINGKLKNKKVIEEINFLLNTDIEFKNCYEELIHSIDFLNKAELNSPPDFYFNNLSVNINRKISALENNKVKRNWKKIFQYITPAAAIIIFVIFILSNNHQEIEPEISSFDNSEIQIDNESRVNTEDDYSSEPLQEKEIIENEISKPEKPDIQVNRKSNSSNYISNNYSNQNVVEREFDAEYYPIIDIDDNYLIEDEFENLSPDQKREILNNLSKADL